MEINSLAESFFRGKISIEEQDYLKCQEFHLGTIGKVFKKTLH